MLRPLASLVVAGLLVGCSVEPLPETDELEAAVEQRTPTRSAAPPAPPPPALPPPSPETAWLDAIPDVTVTCLDGSVRPAYEPPIGTTTTWTEIEAQTCGAGNAPRRMRQTFDGFCSELAIDVESAFYDDGADKAQEATEYGCLDLAGSYDRTTFCDDLTDSVVGAYVGEYPDRLADEVWSACSSYDLPARWP